MRADIVVVGGGFYGCYLADFYARVGKKVIVIEREKQLLLRASKNNQARIHGGYHYPRSTLTALRSRVLLEKFVKEFKECVFDEFDMYYMIGHHFSKVTTPQFVQFCKRIDAPLENASDRIKQLVNPQLIDSVFKVKEFAFNVDLLREIMVSRLDRSNVKILYGHSVEKVGQIGDKVALDLCGPEAQRIEAVNVFNCTYAGLNSFHKKSLVDIIPLKYEKVEIALINAPDEFKEIGITVMCGPFFSTMPYPSESLHSLTHVRYTPQFSWVDQGGENTSPAILKRMGAKNVSNYKAMMLDAKRFIPGLSGSQYVNSVWDVKTILPKNEINDGRPILLRLNYCIKGYHCVLGGKIDNIYDILATLQHRKIGL